MTAKYNESGFLNNLSLGKVTEYHSTYQPDLLQGVPRSLNRNDLNLDDDLPFLGVDLWTGYEVSWLNTKGKPIVAIAEFFVPITSPNLIESKSFKLYLNSFNQSKFDDWAMVHTAMISDLSRCAGAPVNVRLHHVSEVEHFQITGLPGKNIDDIDIDVSDYEFNRDYLALATDNSASVVTAENTVTETLNSHLLKSNCLITNQPDWASVVIEYTGAKICETSLLRYFVSFRMHNEFHEQCVERIFTDIMDICQPSELSVYARYTRRGGLDINPFRSNKHDNIPYQIRTNRQ